MKPRNNYKRITGVLITLIVMGGYVQTVIANETGYEPLGIHTGSFFIYPAVRLGLTFDENLFRLPEQNTENTGAIIDEVDSDSSMTAGASVTINSDWNRHALNGIISIDAGQYDEFEGENYQNYLLGIDGRFDIKRGIYFTAKAGTRKNNEDRSSVDSREVDSTPETPTVFGIEPTQLGTDHLGVAYVYHPAKLGIEFDVNFQSLNYENTTSVFGENVNNTDRDRTLADVSLRLGYEILPQRSVYIQAQVDNVDYELPFDDNGIARTSEGTKISAGVNFQLNNLLVGDVFVGRVERNYDSLLQTDISSDLIGLDLTWFPTRLMSVIIGLDKSIEESTEESTSGYLSSTASLSVTHELKRNIIISLHADLTKNEFEQNVANQKEQEQITGYGLGINYKPSRRWYLSLDYRHEERESDIQLQEYTNDQILFSLGLNW